MAFRDISLERHKSYKQILNISFNTIKTSRAILVLIAYSAVIYSLGMFFTWYAQIIYKNQLNLDPRNYGFINVLFVLTLFAGSNVLLCFTRFVKLASFLWITTLLYAIGFSALFVDKTFASLIASGVIIYLSKGFSSPAFSTIINHSISDGKTRATVLSINSLISSLFYGLFIFFISFWVSKNETVVLFGILFLLFVLLVLILKRKSMTSLNAKETITSYLTKGSVE